MAISKLADGGGDDGGVVGREKRIRTKMQLMATPTQISLKSIRRHWEKKYHCRVAPSFLRCAARPKEIVVWEAEC